jgi:fructose-bisphosphate aldolase, class I
MEHGPTEFNDDNVDPTYIINIARDGKYDAVIFQKGIAEKYNKEIKKSKVPLIIKMNGKTNLYDGEPMSEQLCTVKEAIKLGASAVGYTIYIGSKHESKMLSEFENIKRDAVKAKIPVIAWVYPGKANMQGRTDDEVMAYAARIALEIGADIAKIKYTGNPKALAWAVKSAAKCQVVVAGGVKTEESQLLKNIADIRDAGAAGIAIGRNIWKAKDPIALTNKIRKVLLGKD